MSIIDPRDQMTVQELVDELHLRFPEQVAAFERRHGDAMEALEFDSDCDEDLLENLADDLRILLRV